jgi:hypothetical protein
MRIAYLILAHKNPQQIERMFRAIYHPDNHYLFHIDRKSPPECHACVVRWASFSVIDTTLLGIRQLMELSPHWDMFMNLSGQDFPLRSQDEIRDKLAANADRNFVEHFDPMPRWEDALARIRRIRISPPFTASAFNIPKIRIDRWSRYLGNATYFGGSSYFVLSRRFCEFMIGSPEFERYRRFFRFTYTSDEIFIQTFIMNSAMRDTVVNDNLRQLNWSEGKAQPKIYTMADREELLGSDALFARKFDVDVDADIYGLLEQRLASR